MVSKRAFDLVLGTLLCIVAVPVVLALALVLAIQHRGNPFFVHDRVGYRGRIIAIPKLRTLTRETPTDADKTETELQTTSAFAGWLRRTHLDELPQLFLVPFGRLSLVGPRPRMVREASSFADEALDELRTSVPQGCTGLWQVSVDQGGRVSDHPEYPTFYVEQRTLRFDLWILWRTGLQLLGASPVTLDEVPRRVLARPDLVLAPAGS